MLNLMYDEDKGESTVFSEGQQEDGGESSVSREVGGG